MSVAAKLLAGGLGKAWNIDNATFVSNYTLPIGGYSNDLVGGFHINRAGTDILLVGHDDIDLLHITLSTPWDFSTATFVDVTRANPPTSFGRAFACSVSDDGLHVYVTYDGLQEAVAQIDLTSPFDYSTASFVDYKTIPTYRHVFIKPGGDRLYVGDFILPSGPNAIAEYSLSTPYDITSATFVQKIGNNSDSYSRLFFKPDGSRFYLCGRGTTGSNDFREFKMTTPWDVSTSSLVRSSDIGIRDWQPIFKPDGKKLVLGFANSVSEFNLE